MEKNLIVVVSHGMYDDVREVTAWGPFDANEAEAFRGLVISGYKRIESVTDRITGAAVLPLRTHEFSPIDDEFASR